MRALLIAMALGAYLVAAFVVADRTSDSRAERSRPLAPPSNEVLPPRTAARAGEPFRTELAVVGRGHIALVRRPLPTPPR